MNTRRLLVSPLWLFVALLSIVGINASSAAATGGPETRVRAIEHVSADAAGQRSGETPGSVGCVRPETVAMAVGSCVATNTVQPYEVGVHNDLVSRSARGDGLQIHHAVQDHPAQQLIPGATTRGGPAIALPDVEHRAIPNLKGDVSLTPRQLLAHDAWNLRNYTNAPNPAIQALIGLNKSTYPGAFVK